MDEGQAAAATAAAGRPLTRVYPGGTSSPLCTMMMSVMGRNAISRSLPNIRSSTRRVVGWSSTAVATEGVEGSDAWLAAAPSKNDRVSVQIKGNCRRGETPPPTQGPLSTTTSRHGTAYPLPEPGTATGDGGGRAVPRTWRQRRVLALPHGRLMGSGEIRVPHPSHQGKQYTHRPKARAPKCLLPTQN